MLTEMRDTIGLLLLGQGIDPSTVDSFEAAAAAFDQLSQAKADGQIRAFTGNDYLDDLATGNFAACIGWSGDVVQLARDNPSVKFIIPEEGGMSWADTMVMPKGATNRDQAAAWMDFVYDPVQAAQITAWVQFVSPVAGVQEEVAKLDRRARREPAAVPRRRDAGAAVVVRQPERGGRGGVRRRLLGDHRGLSPDERALVVGVDRGHPDPPRPPGHGVVRPRRAGGGGRAHPDRRRPGRSPGRSRRSPSC